MMSKPVEVTIVCPNAAVARTFMSWLDGQGEQDYPEWHENALPDAPGVKFIYDYKQCIITLQEYKE